MELKVKPIFVIGSRKVTRLRSDGTRETAVDGEALALKAAELSQELRGNLQFSATLLEDSIVRSEHDLTELKRKGLEADALLVYIIGVIPLQTIFQWGLPIVVFSGQYTTMLALYAFGVERHSQPGITIALDFQDIDEEIQLLEARKKLQNTRIALFGFPPPFFSRWHHLPDLELAREKLGVEFIPVELRELATQLPMINDKETYTLAERWRQEAKEVIEPSTTEILDSARLYLALSNVMKQTKTSAMAINCLEWIDSLKAPPPCYPMTRLRDEGIHAACESDVTCLLTMMLLGYLADRPAFMGNIVSANPESNILMVAHCITPTRMAGFDQPPLHYILRDHHGEDGVTAHVELDKGQEVTIARLARKLDKIVFLKGELVDCRDTTFCRTTISIRVSNVRKFFQYALGNHHVVVYGNHTRQLKALSQALGIDTIEL